MESENTFRLSIGIEGNKKECQDEKEKRRLEVERTRGRRHWRGSDLQCAQYAVEVRLRGAVPNGAPDHSDASVKSTRLQRRLCATHAHGRAAAGEALCVGNEQENTMARAREIA